MSEVGGQAAASLWRALALAAVQALGHALASRSVPPKLLASITTARALLASEGVPADAIPCPTCAGAGCVSPPAPIITAADLVALREALGARCGWPGGRLPVAKTAHLLRCSARALTYYEAGTRRMRDGRVVPVAIAAPVARRAVELRHQVEAFILPPKWEATRQAILARQQRARAMAARRRAGADPNPPPF